MSGEGLLPNNPYVEDDGFVTVHPPIAHFRDRRFTSRPVAPMRERPEPRECR